MTQSQMAFIQNIKPEESYRFFSQVDDKTVKLLSSNNRNTLSISTDDLKFLLDNELINVNDLNITAAGRLAIVPGRTHSVNVDNLNRFKQDVTNELEEQRRSKIEQIKRQREAEYAEELRQKVMTRKTVFGAFLGLMKDFKRVEQPRQFRSQPVQNTVQQTNNINQQMNDTGQQMNNVGQQMNNVGQQPGYMNQQSQYMNQQSGYAQSMNNPNLDSAIM